MVKAMDFLGEVETIHQVQVSWFWDHQMLHDDDYKINTNNLVNKEVAHLTKRYEVMDDTNYCCQFEGRMLIGNDLHQVTVAGRELALYVSRLKHIIPI